MKIIVLSLWFAVSLLAVNAQNLVNDPRVVEYRKDLGHIDSLMQNGIMTEEVSGMDYFTGYAYKTLYDWDQYFESIVQVYMGWEPDYIKNGLSEWMSAPHTGMDNQHERAGFWHDRNCEGVDLNCYLVRETRAFARLAESLWEGAGTNSHSAGQWKIPVRYVGAFAPLWAGVASEEQAESMVMNYLTNPREFWAPYPLATLSKSEPWYSTTLLPSDNGCSWRANTWMPTNYMVYHGLKWYGYEKIATALAHRSVELVEHGGDREYFNSETGEGIGLDPFWGWSLLGHFFMLEEELFFQWCFVDV